MSRKLLALAIMTVMIFVGMISCGGEDACAAPGSGTGSYRPPPVRVSPLVRVSPPTPRVTPRPAAPKIITPRPTQPYVAPRLNPEIPPVVVVPSNYC